jgi:hypothetical protein
VVLIVFKKVLVPVPRDVLCISSGLGVTLGVVRIGIWVGVDSNRGAASIIRDRTGAITTGTSTAVNCSACSWLRLAE